MWSKLSNLVNNLSEIYGKECRGCKEKKKISVCNFIGLKINKLHYKCDDCKKRQLKPINVLIKKFPNTYKLCNNDINKFILLIKKGFHPYEYMDSWERFDETSLPDKKSFYSELYPEDITDKDYTHDQKVFVEFELKDLREYHDLYVESDLLLLPDVFENFRNKCIEIYNFDLAHFLSAPGLAWRACWKKNGVKLELLTDIYMLLMVKKEVRGGICHAIQRYAKVNNKYMKKIQ